MVLHQAPLLIFSLFFIVSVSGLGGRHGCPPSSCGPLQDIRSPFRLKGVSPPECGDGGPSFELSCEDNKPILELHSAKYTVQSISYGTTVAEARAGDGAIQITDTRFAAGGCALPSRTLSANTIYNDDRFYLLSLGLISFINCTKELQGHAYTHIPCLSGINASVYIVFNSSLAALAPSCRFLAMVPTIDGLDANTEAQVFALLQKGFIVSYSDWGYMKCGSVSFVIKECLMYTFNPLLSPYLFFFYHMFFIWLYFPCPDLPTYCSFNYAIFKLIKIAIVLIHALFFLVVARLLVMLLLKVITVSAFLAYKFRQKRIPLDAVEKFLLNQQSLSPARFAYMDIIVMTRNFKDKLGQGGFGSVYKGELPGGFQVAVKMLGNSKCNGDDFISEVSTLGTIHHVNIVRLVGFCSDGSKRALVYEYLAKGSLDKYIFSAKAATQRPFTWEKLVDIALGVARGIDYLHGGCNKRILHFDIKPHNILLDNRFNPMVSDFGLAKLFPKDHSMVALGAFRGTIGYVAPELISRSFGIISHKSDVYSFGMLLLEMAGGRRNVDKNVENTSQIYYPSWIYDQLNDKNGVDGEVDSIVKDVMTLGEVEKKLSIVGLWCIQTTPSVRPSMSRVIEMLQADVDTLQMPPKPLSAETFSSVPIMDCSTENSSTTLTAISEDESLLCPKGQHHSSCQSGHDELFSGSYPYISGDRKWNTV